MKTAEFKIRRKINVEVIATAGKVRIKYPKQILGTIAFVFRNKTKSVLLKQVEIVLEGGRLLAREVER